MEENYIIDCSGRRVPVGDKLFSAKCWVGNTTDFLSANAADVIAETLDWPLPHVSIVVPIYRSGLGFVPTLASLLSQEWASPADVEIILYLNQPPGEIEPLTEESLGHLRGISPARNGPALRVLFEQLEGGIAAVYRRSFASLVARIRRSVDARNLATKPERVEALDNLMSSIAFAVVDDDLVFVDNYTFPERLRELEACKSLILGEVQVTEVSCAYPRWNQALLNSMNLFLRFKHELGSAILTPRAAIVRDLFHLPAIDSKVPYADQIWFAAAAQSKNKMFVPVRTTVVEETYPSNAEMSARLARFLETGADESAVSIFENLLCPYGQAGASRKYNQQDVAQLVTLLKGRDLVRIQEYSNALLAR